jgi:hypothetical protein
VLVYIGPVTIVVAISLLYRWRRRGQPISRQHDSQNGPSQNRSDLHR